MNVPGSDVVAIEAAGEPAEADAEVHRHALLGEGRMAALGAA